MRRVEVYLNRSEQVCLAIFKNLNSEYESLILKGSDAFEYINKITMYKLLNFQIDKNRSDVTLEYEDCLVHLNDYLRLLNKKNVTPIIRDIKKYNEKKQVAKHSRRKVKRVNKHAGMKIIAVGLSLAMIATLVINYLDEIKGKINIIVDNFSSKSIVSQEDDVLERVKALNEIIDQNENTITTEKTEEKQESESIKEDNSVKVEEQPKSISLGYEDRSDTKKAIFAEENYGEIITKYATMYGIDPSLALAVATQERGIHSSTMDSGGATGLMQIQNSVWLNEEVSAYNFKTESIEKFIVTQDKIKDLEYNIKIGCMVLQNTLQYMKYNPIAAIQCYNMGYANMMKILNKYSNVTGKPIDEILSDKNDIGWLDCRDEIKVGDQKYVENVLSWIGDDIDIRCVKTDGELIDISIDNNNQIKR